MNKTMEMEMESNLELEKEPNRSECFVCKEYTVTEYMSCCWHPVCQLCQVDIISIGKCLPDCQETTQHINTHKESNDDILNDFTLREVYSLARKYTSMYEKYIEYFDDISGLMPYVVR
jgi:hypothetical protein